LRKIGLHIRLNQTIFEVARRAAALNIPIFQCFFIQQESNQFMTVTDEQIEVFLREWRSKFENLYLHGSYWINLASAQSHNKIIMREIELAKKLAFTHIIIHPGSTKKGHHKRDGIGVIARNLNRLLKTENAIQVVLENTAHAGLSIGGDLHDFLSLKERLDHPEKVMFCIDTAHAFAYGYDFRADHARIKFLELIEKTVGFNAIALIHLNDIKQQCGSRIDKHEKVGEGTLGDSLRQLISQKQLEEIPIIMELPIMKEVVKFFDDDLLIQLHKLANLAYIIDRF
jgi:deoxyribonuclease-4